MFTVTSLPLAIAFCVVTMIGWGSWANTQKLAGRDHWPFSLYYWDYALGVVLLAVALLVTLGGGSLGDPGGDAVLRAALSGLLFNIANILLVVAIDLAGMSVAFPVGVGLALVIGTVASYLQQPQGNPSILFAGVALNVFAMIMSALAYRTLPRPAGSGWSKGVAYSVLAGCLMGYFYPQLSQSISPGGLTPYAALLYFSLGLVASNFAVNSIFMRSSGQSYRDYFAGSPRLHSLGLLGGMIWMLALSLNILASGVAGPAISYALGQGATLVAAIWGVFIWREFRHAPPAATRYIVLMFAGYAVGLVLIGMATLPNT